MTLLAEDKEGMRAMIARLEGYLKRNKMEVNVRKTKIIVFRKGRRKRKKTSWR